jgi:diacylglycerol kinase family enzyme
MFNTRKFMSRISSDMEPAGIDVSQMKVGAIINTSSGGCDSESEAEMLDILKGAGVTNCKTWCGESDQIERAFAEAATHKPEVLVVLGGDGTMYRTPPNYLGSRPRQHLENGVMTKA